VRSPQLISFAAWAVVSSSGTMPTAGVDVSGVSLPIGHPLPRLCGSCGYGILHCIRIEEIAVACFEAGHLSSVGLLL